MKEPTSRRHTIAPGFELAADWYGPDSDDRVVFLHGGGQTRHSWRGAAAAIADKGWQAVSLDLRGHGESDWHPEARYEVTDFAADVATLIADWPRPPVVVGASLGGMSAMLLGGVIAPGSLRALVLVDIVPRMSIEGANRVKNFMRDRADEGFGSLEDVADAVAAYNPHRPRPDDLSGLAKNLRQRDGRWFWHWDPAFILRLDDDVEVSQARQPDLLSDALHAVEAPLLLVRGRMSDLVTEDGAKAFLAEFPHAGFVDVSGAGHMVAGDKNDVFTDAVLDFIDQEV